MSTDTSTASEKNTDNPLAKPEAIQDIKDGLTDVGIGLGTLEGTLDNTPTGDFGRAGLSVLNHKVSALQIFLSGQKDGVYGAIGEVAGVGAGTVASNATGYIISTVIGITPTTLAGKLLFHGTLSVAGSYAGDAVAGATTDYLKQHTLDPTSIDGYHYDEEKGSWYLQGPGGHKGALIEQHIPQDSDLHQKLTSIRDIRLNYDSFEKDTGQRILAAKDGTSVSYINPDDTQIDTTEDYALLTDEFGLKVLFFEQDGVLKSAWLDAADNIIPETLETASPMDLLSYLNYQPTDPGYEDIDGDLSGVENTHEPRPQYDHGDDIDGDLAVADLPPDTPADPIQINDPSFLGRPPSQAGENDDTYLNDEGLLNHPNPSYESQNDDVYLDDEGLLNHPNPSYESSNDGNTAPSSEQNDSDATDGSTTNNAVSTGGTPADNGTDSTPPDDGVFLEDEGLLGHPNPSYESPTEAIPLSAEEQALLDAQETLIARRLAELEQNQADAETVAELQQSHAAYQSVLSLIRTVENGNDLEIGVQAVSTLNQLNNVFEFTEITTEGGELSALGQAGAGAGALLAVNNLVSSIEDGDAVAITQAGLSTYSAASSALVAVNGPAAALPGIGTVNSVLGPLNIAVSLANGDPLGALSSALMMTGNPIAIGIGIVLSVFGGLFGGDPFIPYAPPQGSGRFFRDDDGKLSYELQGVDANFAAMATTSLGNRLGDDLLDRMDGDLASGSAIINAALQGTLESLRADLQNGESLVPERLPQIQFLGHHFELSWLGADGRPASAEVAPMDLIDFMVAQAQANQAVVEDFEAATIEAKRQAGQEAYWLTEEQLASLAGIDDPAGYTVLALDLNGDGQLHYSDGLNQLFDHDSDGFREAVQWIGGEDGMLVLDRDLQDGIVDGAHLLNGALTGLQALAFWDVDNNGLIDARDPAYQAMRIWQDINQDAEMQAGENRSLESLGITAIHYAGGYATTAGGLLSFGAVALAATEDGVQIERDATGRLETYEFGDQHYIVERLVGVDEAAEQARLAEQALQNRPVHEVGSVTVEPVEIVHEYTVQTVTLDDNGNIVGDNVQLIGYDGDPDALLTPGPIPTVSVTRLQVDHTDTPAPQLPRVTIDLGIGDTLTSPPLALPPLEQTQITATLGDIHITPVSVTPDPLPEDDGIASTYINLIQDIAALPVADDPVVTADFDLNGLTLLSEDDLQNFFT